MAIHRALCPVLVGRAKELTELEDALLAANRGEGQVVLLTGDAGLGKTRLANELSHHARGAGTLVLWGGCSEGEVPLPYLPFLEAIGNYLVTANLDELRTRLGPDRRELGNLFPRLDPEGSRTDTGDPTQNKLRLYEAILSLLGGLAADHGLLLVLEDLHWSDPSTRELLDYLSRRLRSARILVLATYRRDEIHRKHPLLPLIQAWRRSGLTGTVELAPLPPDGVSEMVTAIFDDPTRDDTRDFLYARSEGNPFVLEEVLKVALDRGHIFRTPNGWGRKELSEFKLPESVRDMILLRLQRLAPAEVELLRAGSVLGNTFAYTTVASLTGRDEDVVQEALEVCVQQQLLEEAADGRERYRFRHALTREAIYEELVLPKRRQLHARAAEVLRSDPQTPVVEIARHLIAAGRWAEALPLCIKAAEEAEARWAMHDAAALFELALPHVDDPLEQARLLCRLGTAYVYAGESLKAQPPLESGIAQLEAAGQRLEAARFRIALGRVHWERLEKRLAYQEYERARSALEPAGPSHDLAMAYLRLSGIHGFEYEGQEAAELALRAIETAEAAGSDVARIWAYTFYGSALDSLGSADQALAYLGRGYEEAMQHGFLTPALNAAYNAVFHNVYRLRAREAGPEFNRRMVRFGNWERARLLMASGWGFMHYCLGDLAKAADANREAASLARLQGMESHVTRHDRWLGLVLAEMGQLDEAGRLVRKPETGWERQDIFFAAMGWIRYQLARGDAVAAADGARPIHLDRVRFAVHPMCADAAVEGLLSAGHRLEAEELGEAVRRGPYADAPHARRIEGRLALHATDPAAEEILRDSLGGFISAGYRVDELRTRLLLAEALAGEEAVAQLREVLEGARRMGALTLARAAARQLHEPAFEPTAEATTPGTVASSEKLVTVMFADVRGYTAMTREAAPADIADRISSFYRWAEQEILRHHGTVAQHSGDAVMATFNVSGMRLDHSRHALETAIALRDKASYGGLPVGIGIAVGPAIVGKFSEGSPVTALGETVNLAARLQGEAAAGEILLSEEAHRRVRGSLAEEARRDRLDLKGFDQPVTAYRLSSRFRAT